jgi:hypothetical protein
MIRKSLRLLKVQQEAKYRERIMGIEYTKNDAICTIVALLLRNILILFKKIDNQIKSYKRYAR